MSELNNSVYILNLINDVLNSETYFLKSNLSIEKKPLIFPFRNLNYMVRDSILFEGIMGELYSVHDLIVERNLPVSVREINKKLKTNSIILLGDVKNIPLLSIQRNIHASERTSEADRTLLIVFDELAEGKRESYLKRLQNERKIYQAKINIDSPRLMLKVMSEMMESVLQNVNELAVNSGRYFGEHQNINILGIAKEIKSGNIDLLKGLSIIQSMGAAKLEGNNSMALQRNLLKSIFDSQNPVIKESSLMQSNFDLMLKDLDLMNSVSGALFDSKNLMDNMKSLNRATFWQQNDMSVQNSINKGTLYTVNPLYLEKGHKQSSLCVAKPVILEKQAFQGLMLDKKDFGLLTEFLQGFIKPDERERTIPIRIGRIFQALLEGNEPIYIMKSDTALRDKIKATENGFIKVGDRTLSIKEVFSKIENYLSDGKNDRSGKLYEDFMSGLDIEKLSKIEAEEILSEIEQRGWIGILEEGYNSGKKLGNFGEILDEGSKALKQMNSYSDVSEDLQGTRQDFEKNSKIEKSVSYGAKDILVLNGYSLQDVMIIGKNLDREKDAIIDLEDLNAEQGVGTYFMTDYYLGSRNFEHFSDVVKNEILGKTDAKYGQKNSLDFKALKQMKYGLEFLEIKASKQDRITIGKMIDDISGEKLDKFGKISKEILSIKDSKDAIMESIKVADKIAEDRLGEFIDSVIAESIVRKAEYVSMTEADRQTKFQGTINETLSGVVKEKLAEMIEGVTADSEDSKGFIETLEPLASIDKKQFGSIIDNWYSGDKYKLSFEQMEMFLALRQIDLGSVVSDLISGEQQKKYGNLVEQNQGSKVIVTMNSILENVMIKSERVIHDGVIQIGLTADTGSKAVVMVLNYLADRNIIHESLIMENDNRATKPVGVSILENQILGQFKNDRLALLLQNQKVAQEVLQSVELLNIYNANIQDYFGGVSKILNSAKADDYSGTVPEIINAKIQDYFGITQKILGANTEEGKGSIQQIAEAMRDYKLQGGIYQLQPKAIGAESPEDLWGDASIYDPNTDLNEDDPSGDKSVPNRWYDEPETPATILEKMIIELKDRNQNVHVPAEQTANMIKDILDDFLKNHVKTNTDEFDTMIHYIEALMEAYQHKSCVMREEVEKNSEVSYLKDFQEPGSWKDPEFVGSDQPPEEQGGGSWANVDLTKPSGATAAQLDAVFALNGGYLAGLGQACIDAEKHYGTNAFYVAAHSVWESGWGKSKIAQDKNNLFGYGAYDWNPYECAWFFESKAECVDVVMRNVGRDYLTPKGKYWGGSPTLRGMNKMYATDNNWSNGIAKLMKQFAGGNPPNSLLYGFASEPITNWYRYQEPEDEVLLEKAKYPNTDDPNWALHTPDGMAVNQKSDVSLTKSTKLEGDISYRVKVNGGTNAAESRVFQTDHYDRSIWNPDANNSYGHLTYTVSGFPERDWDRQDIWWNLENSEAIARASSELAFNYASDYPTTIEVTRALTLQENPGTVISTTPTRRITDSFPGYYNDSGTATYFTENDDYMKANGWRFYNSGFAQGALTGDLVNAAHGKLTYTVNYPEGGQIDMGYVIWCDSQDNGFQVLIDGNVVFKERKYGLGYPSGDYRNEEYSTINIPKGYHTITVQCINSLPGYLFLDYVYLTEFVPTYSGGTGGTYGSYLEIYVDGVRQKSYTSTTSKNNETIAVNLTAGTRHYIKFRFMQYNPSYSDYAEIDELIITENIPAKPYGNSFMKFYIDGVLRRTTNYTGKAWVHITEGISQGQHKFTWEFTEMDSGGYGLIDDIKITGMDAKINTTWVCPPDSGDDLIDDILDKLKDETKPRNPENIESKIWLFT